MLDGTHLYSLRESRALQKEHSTTQLPLQDLCYATYTLPDGKKIIVDVIGTDDAETQAILSHIDEESRERKIWHAYRNQSGEPGTWLWTEEQLEAAKRNPTRIRDEENYFNFRGDTTGEHIQAAPIHKDRRIEILMLGLTLGKSDAEVQERLRAAGVDDTLPANYRTEQGELDLLKNWLPE